MSDIRSVRSDNRSFDRRNAVTAALAMDAMAADSNENRLADSAMLSRHAELDGKALVDSRTAGGPLRKTPRGVSEIRPEQLNIRDRGATNATSAALARQGLESQGQEGRPRRATKYPSWEEQRSAGLTAQSSEIAPPDPSFSGNADPSEMTFTAQMLVGLIGGTDDVLDFLSGWFPGIASMVSAGLDVGQIVVIIFDTNSKNISAKEKRDLLIKRVGIVIAVWAVEGIPVVNLLPLQSFLVSFLLKQLRNKSKQM
ncbi:MAG: hypothetical protein HGA31_00090 [Candidatus Moranbacteria bacterium]|nr:hypothetical protein [Candidatus Moranbacteria bacterium]